MFLSVNRYLGNLRCLISFQFRGMVAASVGMVKLALLKVANKS